MRKSPQVIQKKLLPEGKFRSIFLPPDPAWNLKLQELSPTFATEAKKLSATALLTLS
ncbi:hypothetical protein BRCON_0487 [Candidatus Sumerlaea chitinivorans]|uniref:Uncharacterized protein n=1 Tax=Sumerlaea chitinivorans TaxID=2250252 RepID=A0A2Z4Y2I2_SUMC1|nr:hypothetical protein BRCON_0487 [Candidatus Sumerlaea chitinivorans]